ncbi:MAG: carboxy terminal-processing peptidase, partial [Paracoccaceae bacterium]|nr:carboxy terminal-processing peptidase [Paracoccaceae bacterium]
RHQTRMQTNPEFQYITSAYNYRRVRREIKAISLNETTRRAEQAIAKTFWLDLTNKKRVAQGLPVIADLEELEEAETLASEDAVVDPLLPPDAPISGDITIASEAENAIVTQDGAVIALEQASPTAQAEDENAGAGNVETDKTTPEDAPEEPDAYVVEAGHILADLISLRNQTAKQSSTAAPS